MKWSIVALATVGLIAAGAAAFLVSSLRPAKAAAISGPVPEDDVLFAARSMPALSVVEAAGVVIRKVPHGQAPPNAMTDTAAVVGRVLRQPVVEGQAFSPGVLAAKDSGINLAAAVHEGMRAVSVSLSDYEAIEGLLYPGSVVDVLFAFKAPSDSQDQAEQTVSMTLLKAVQVLAIQGRTILASSGTDDPPSAGAHSQGHQMVALMVTPKQAELLQLAQKFGSISLSMRNPMDARTDSSDETLLSQLSEVLKKRARLAPPPAAPKAAPAEKPASDIQWHMTVIRGSAIEQMNVPLPVSEGGK